MTHERDRIRAKLSETDRQFLDDLREVFPDAKMQFIRFSDGEQLGKPLPQGEKREPTRVERHCRMVRQAQR